MSVEKKQQATNKCAISRLSNRDIITSGGVIIADLRAELLQSENVSFTVVSECGPKSYYTP